MSTPEPKERPIFLCALMHCLRDAQAVVNMSGNPRRPVWLGFCHEHGTRALKGEAGVCDGPALAVAVKAEG